MVSKGFIDPHHFEVERERFQGTSFLQWTKECQRLFCNILYISTKLLYRRLQVSY